MLLENMYRDSAIEIVYFIYCLIYLVNAGLKIIKASNFLHDHGFIFK